MLRTWKKLPLTFGAVALVALTLSGCEVEGSGRFVGQGFSEGTSVKFSTETKIDISGFDPSTIDWDELESTGEFKLKNLLAGAGAAKKSSSEWDIELKFSLEKLLERIEDLGLLASLTTASEFAANSVSALGEGSQCMGFLGEFKGKGLWNGPTVAPKEFRNRGLFLGLLAEGTPSVGSTSTKSDVETYLVVLAVSYEAIWEYLSGSTSLSSEGILSALGRSLAGVVSATSLPPGVLFWQGEASKAKFDFDVPIGASCLDFFLPR